jgi:hypothetical protein
VLPSLAKYLLCLSWYPFLFLCAVLLYRFVEQPSIQLGKSVQAKINKSPLILRG